MLEIIGQTRLEASHEKLIAWLLHPLANHGLGPGVLASLLARLDDDRMPLPEQLTRAHVRTQVVGASGRPDIVVTMSGARLVIELKIDAKEGIAQTSRQADDYIGVPDVSFVFLTLGGSPPSDPRFKHLLLRDHLSQIPDPSHGGGERWGPWARWWYINLEPPDGNNDLLAYYAASTANQVTQF